ncbi:unnamed protein product [Brachionus calyciflorus]|uniref:Intimal thickness related receptor IRP domain-containing protein n=1 Tax=Brachionus calyciflorus TaxID=104777 RepID=A0A814C8Q9_9BILA|nr:unnamed protein product [Brachionus calyciflorus]
MTMYIFYLLILFYPLPLSYCLILEGDLSSNKDFVILGKFCFISEKSRFTYNISYPDSYKVQNLLLYYDDQWTNAQYSKKPLTCKEKEYELTQSQTLSLNASNFGVGCSETEINAVKSITCNSRRAFITMRARYWFIVVARCDSNGVKIKYKMEFTNGDDTFRRHFSADEFGILETSIAFFIIYFILLIICAVFAKILINKSLFHVTVRLYIVSVLFQFLTILFMVAEYGQYSISGYVTPGMITTSHIFQVIGQIIFLFMLILVAKGYTITRNKLRIPTWIKMGIFFAIYVIAYVVTFIFSEALYDVGKVNYYYNSPAGIAVVLIKMILGWIWFGYSILFTIKNFPEKRTFYVILSITFSIWFLIGPFLILMCNFFIQDYIRQFVAYLIEIIVIFIGHFIFLILIRPTAENKLFPFHVKTNQIIDGSFPHHAEDQGGNINLNDAKTNLANLFVIQNNGHKYQVDQYSVEPGANDFTRN